MKCINCARFKFKNSGMDKNDMPLLGFGHCDLIKNNAQFVSFSYERDCCNFVEISEIEISARRDEYREIKYPKSKTEQENEE